jgi:hypothetical protein
MAIKPITGVSTAEAVSSPIDTSKRDWEASELVG